MCPRPPHMYRRSASFVHWFEASVAEWSWLTIEDVDSGQRLLENVHSVLPSPPCVGSYAARGIGNCMGVLLTQSPT